MVGVAFIAAVGIFAMGIVLGIVILTSVNIRREERRFQGVRRFGEEQGGWHAGATSVRHEAVLSAFQPAGEPEGLEEQEREDLSKAEPQGDIAEVAAPPPAPSREAEFWRWLGLVAGGTLLPFLIFGLAYWLVSGHLPGSPEVLGRGELFIPASVMNAEAILICSYITIPGRSVWFPIVAATCGLAALCGAVCYGVTSALDSAPYNRVQVAHTTLQQLAKTVTLLSAGEFLLALVVGTVGVVLFMLARGEEVPVHD